MKYPKDHEVVLYLASNHRIFDSTIIKTELQNLEKTKFDPISTMIILPKRTN